MAGAGGGSMSSRLGEVACETWKRKFVSGNPSYVRDPSAHMWLGRSKSLGAQALPSLEEVLLRPRVTGFVGHVPGRRDVVGRQDLSLAQNSPRAIWGKRLPPVQGMQRLGGFAGHVPSLRSRVGFRGCDLPDLDNATRRGGPEAAALGYPTELGMKLHQLNEEAIHGPTVDHAARHDLRKSEPHDIEVGVARAPPPAHVFMQKNAHMANVYRVLGAPETWNCMARSPAASEAYKVEQVFDPRRFQEDSKSRRREGFQKTQDQRRYAQGVFDAQKDLSTSEMSDFFKERRNLRKKMERQRAHDERDLAAMRPAGGKAQTTVLDMNYFVRGKKLEDMAGVFQPKNMAVI